MRHSLSLIYLLSPLPSQGRGWGRGHATLTNPGGTISVRARYQRLQVTLDKDAAFSAKIAFAALFGLPLTERA